MQGIEGIEELLLGGVFAGDKLHIVYHQHVYVAVLVAELGVCVVLYGFYQLVCEGLAGNVGYAVGGVLFLYVVAYSVHKVGLAQAHVAVYEQGVVGGGGVVRNGLCGGVGNVVAAAYNEAFKGKLGVEHGLLPAGFLQLEAQILFPFVGGHENDAVVYAGNIRHGGGDGRRIEIAQGIQGHVAGIGENKGVVEHAQRLKPLYPQLIAHGGHALFYQRLGVFPQLMQIRGFLHVTNPLLKKLSTLLIILLKTTKSRRGLFYYRNILWK